MVETICAQATAIGRGGIGIIRVSGAQSLAIAQKISHITPKPRYAHYLPFYDQQNTILDYGIVLYFPAPHSFTGEDVVEFQAHGGPVLLSLLLKTIMQFGARAARPGEFSERAFLNNKMDLSQAEAIADLIDASSEQAARSALKSLRGDFSKKINQLADEIIDIRKYVEAAIDFPQEEIDFLSDGVVERKVQQLLQTTQSILNTANQGSLLTEGMHIAIAGQPNAGKSSLLNALSGEELAIVTDIPGTTRDILKQEITIDGMPLHVMDTAGLRESDCKVEQIGIRKAKEALQKADQILLMVDITRGLGEYDREILQTYPHNTTIIYNKIDKQNRKPAIKKGKITTEIYLSAQKPEGVCLLTDYLKEIIGYTNMGEGVFSARKRHIHALQQAKAHIQQGLQQLQLFQAGELLAEELALAHQQLGSITGAFSADDLLGEIFSGFCIGK